MAASRVAPYALQGAIREMRARVLARLVEKLGGGDRATAIMRNVGTMTDHEVMAKEIERMKRPWWMKLIAR